MIGETIVRYIILEKLRRIYLPWAGLPAQGRGGMGNPLFRGKL